jgi:hypothetical protein
MKVISLTALSLIPIAGSKVLGIFVGWSLFCTRFWWYLIDCVLMMMQKVWPLPLSRLWIFISWSIFLCSLILAFIIKEIWLEIERRLSSIIWKLGLSWILWRHFLIIVWLVIILIILLNRLMIKVLMTQEQ